MVISTTGPGLITRSLGQLFSGHIKTGGVRQSAPLNRNGVFSAAESRAAKAALREDTRQSFVSAMGSGDAYSMIANYSKQLASQYDAMSPEERQARGWTEDFRNTNADFATNFEMPSLFDQM